MNKQKFGIQLFRTLVNRLYRAKWALTAADPRGKDVLSDGVESGKQMIVYRYTASAGQPLAYFLRHLRSNEETILMPSVPDHIVVVGAGLAGLRTVEQLRGGGHRGSITLIGAEGEVPYDRPPLSKQVLTGAWLPEQTALTHESSLSDLGLNLRLGTEAVGLHGTTVELAEGDSVRGDAIVIATGLSSRRLPNQPPSAHTLRTVDDSLALRDALARASSLLVIGGGFIGMEAASSARTLGVETTVIESLTQPLARALGPVGGQICASVAEEAGVQLRCGRSLVRFIDEHTILLDDGNTVSADVILISVGGVPELAWLNGSVLDIPNGIACDTRGRVVGIPHVWAVGDVAAWQDPALGGYYRNEHWSSASDQAAIVACNILGTDPLDPGLPYFWSDQFGLKIQLIGTPELANSTTVLCGSIESSNVAGTALGYFSDDKLVAVVTFGAPRLLARYKKLVTANASRQTTLAFASS